MIGYTATYERRDLTVLQDDRCATCGDRPILDTLVVDHDHVTGQVRGILCRACNFNISTVESWLASGTQRPSRITAEQHFGFLAYLVHPPAAALDGYEPHADSYRQRVLSAMQDVLDRGERRGSTVQVQLRLTDELLAQIDKRAQTVGLSRNAWLVKALEWAVAQPVKTETVTQRV